MNESPLDIPTSHVTLDDESLRRLQAVLLVILDDIASFCEENDICYVLSGGSCLGAVRHHGFIPWDDDIDIDMPRRDYDRFIELFPQQFAHKYVLEAPELTPETGVVRSKVRLRGTTMRVQEDCMPGEHGIYIDIFPIENMFDLAPLRHLHGFASLAMGLLCSCRRFWRDRTFYLAVNEGNSSRIRELRLKGALGSLVSFIPLEAWTKATTRVYSLCKNDQSRLVAVPSGRDHFYGELCPRSQFCKTRLAEFAGRSVRIPLDAEAYLTKHYGDWQVIPEEGNREKHSYLALDFGPYGCEGTEQTEA